METTSKYTEEQKQRKIKCVTFDDKIVEVINKINIEYFKHFVKKKNFF